MEKSKREKKKRILYANHALGHCMCIFEISVSILYGIVHISRPIIPAGPQFISVCIFFFSSSFDCWKWWCIPETKFTQVFSHIFAHTREHTVTKKISEGFVHQRMCIGLKLPNYTTCYRFHWQLCQWTWLWNVEYIKY